MNMSIREIEALTYDKAKEMALEEQVIKGHNCLIVDFADRFGYSILVFKNGKHIYYANNYELHHHYTVSKEGREGLRRLYIEKMNSTLFTDEELMGSVSSYDEYRKKDYFLRNYWIMRYSYVSAFAISKEEMQKVEEGIKTHPYYNGICFCYVADEKIVEDAVKYSEHLNSEYSRLSKNIEVFREMISCELANHEACITCSAGDALKALGLSAISLTDEQRKVTVEELNKQINSYSC